MEKIPVEDLMPVDWIVCLPEANETCRMEVINKFVHQDHVWLMVYNHEDLVRRPIRLPRNVMVWVDRPFYNRKDIQNDEQ
jgi:hypothetical protein